MAAITRVRDRDDATADIVETYMRGLVDSRIGHEWPYIVPVLAMIARERFGVANSVCLLLDSKAERLAERKHGKGDNV